jgi:transcriptional regulator with XRE-family HTH domain
MRLRDMLFGSPALGRQLRLARDRAEVSMSLAACRSGLSRRDIRDVERGRRQVTFAQLEILSGLYGVPLEALLPSEAQSAAPAGARG